MDYRMLGVPLRLNSQPSPPGQTEALGADRAPLAMGARLTEIKEHLRGSNPLISSAAVMVKTTPPGPGLGLPRLGGPDPVHDLAVDTPCGA